MEKIKVSVLVISGDVVYANQVYASIKDITESSDIIISSEFKELSKYLEIFAPDVIFFDYAGIRDLSGVEMLDYANKHALLSRLILMMDAIPNESLVNQTALKQVFGYVLKQNTDRLCDDLLPYIKKVLRRRKNDAIKVQPSRMVVNFIRQLEIENQAHINSCMNIRRELDDARF